MISEPNTIQYAYAIDSHGTLTHISDASRSHAYTCPGCKCPLIPVLGDINAKHFRHSDECCAIETYLHKCAKEAFFYRYQQALGCEMPISLELERRVSCNSARLALLRDETRRCEKLVPARYNLTQFFDNAELERYDKVTGLRPDVMLWDASGEKRCYVEIYVTHPCSQEKIETGIPILEFKVQSATDIQMLLAGCYSANKSGLRVFNWCPTSKTVDTCSADCPVGNTEMSVWMLSDSGRLHENAITLDELDLTINSEKNTWPSTSGPTDQADNLL